MSDPRLSSLVALVVLVAAGCSDPVGDASDVTTGLDAPAPTDVTTNEDVADDGAALDAGMADGKLGGGDTLADTTIDALQLDVPGADAVDVTQDGLDSGNLGDAGTEPPTDVPGATIDGLLADATSDTTAANDVVDAGPTDSGASTTTDALNPVDTSSDATSTGAPAPVQTPTCTPPSLSKLALKPTTPKWSPAPWTWCAKPGWPSPASSEKLVFSEQKWPGLQVPGVVDPCLLAFDYDNDGDMDLVTVQQPGGPLGSRKLITLINHKGTFKQKSTTLPGTHEVEQCIAADLDNDGDQDLLLAGGEGVLQVTRAPNGWAVASSSLPGKGGTVTPAVAVADLDGDGWLDIIAAPYKNHGMEGSGACTCVKVDPPYAKCSGGVCSAGDNEIRIFRNTKTGFVDVTPASTPFIPGDAWSITVHDLDRDGWPDFFLGQEWGAHGWYRNEGKNVFAVHTTGIGMRPWAHVMGSAVADFDGDGWSDLKIADFGADTLYKGTGKGVFDNGSKAANIWPLTTTAVAWGELAADLNNDGWMDIATSTSFVATDATFWGPVSFSKFKRLPGSGHIVHRNTGGAFKSSWLPHPTWASIVVDSTAIAAVDLDADGDLDLLTTVRPGNIQIWRNDTKAVGGVIDVRLVGSKGNRDGAGAWLQVWAQGYVQERYYTPSQGFTASVSPGRFGIGTLAKVDKIVARFPSGMVKAVHHVPAGAKLTITEK